MPYRLKADESIDNGIRRICTEQIDRAVAEIDDAELDRHDAVHQVRKRCKKIRGVLRLVRGELDSDGTYAEENAWFRDAARSLSSIRDAEALVETYDALVERFADQLDLDSLEPIRNRLEDRRREKAEDELGLDERLARFRARMLVARERPADWPSMGREFDALRPGLEKTYRRCRKAFAEAREKRTDEAFHDWRKRVKYHWYHCRLLRDLWPGVMAARRDEADRLADLLGDHHDLAVFRDALSEPGEEFADRDSVALLLELAALHRQSLEEQSEFLGYRLLAEKPRRLGRRLCRYWDAWRGESQIRHHAT